MLKAIASESGHNIGLNEVLVPMLTPNTNYAAATYEQDDEGNASVKLSMCYCHMDTVPGQGTKEFKLIRFDNGRVKRISELVGTKFYGPIILAVDNEFQERVDTGDGLNKLLNKFNR